MKVSSESASQFARALEGLSADERVVRFYDMVGSPVVFTTSFGLEDQVITHLIAERGANVDIVTLDTGRLFPETYSLWAKTEQRYGLRVRPFVPQADALEALIARHGIDGFYGSKPARLACCDVRKIEPLNRALAGANGWITGLRAAQSAQRQEMDVVGVDAARQLLKLNPLFDWTREAALAFAREHDVPINPLHGAGFASIGCAPCTRAIRPGEPERAGRWWWEEDTAKECGLHLTPVDQAVGTSSVQREEARA